MMSSNTDRQNELLDDVDKQRIQVTVPYHPLYGQPLKVLRRIHLADGEVQLAVQLPNGHTQWVAARWTETTPTPLHWETDEIVLFSTASLRDLVIMVASLNQRQQPEACDETSCALSLDHLSPGAAPTTDSPVDRAPAPPTASPAVAPDGRRKR